MNKYIRAISFNYIFFLINTAFFLIITPVAIRFMGEELFGLWVILNAIMLFSGIGMLGMKVVVNKFASEGSKNALHSNSILSAAILILFPTAAFVALVLLLARNWIATQLNLIPIVQEQFSLALIYTALSIIPQFLGCVPSGYLLSQLKNSLARSIEVGINIFMWSGAVAIAFFTQNLSWMALWVLVVQTAGSLILFAIVMPMVPFKWQIESKILRRMLRFSGFSLIETLAITLFQQGDRILVGFVLGPAAAGVYSVGTSVSLRLPLIAGQATEVMLPYASHKNSTNDHTVLYDTYRKLSQIIGIVSGTLAALLILWMDSILSLWISPDYAIKYSSIFRILIFAYLFLSIVRTAHQTLTGIGKVKITSLIYLFVSILMLAGVYILAIRYGLLGAAIANLTMVLLLSFNLVGYKHFTTKFPVKDIVSDSWFALLIPFLAYGITIYPFYSNLVIRLTATLLMLIGSVILIAKTDFPLKFQPVLAKLTRFIHK